MKRSTTKTLTRAFAALSLLLACAPTARAERGAPGSLALLPVFDHRPGAETLITVTNTHPTLGVTIRFDYLDAGSCNEESRFEFLLPNDTFSALTSAHTSLTDHGYVAVMAYGPAGPIKFDHLIVQATVVDSISSLDCTFEAFQFRAGAALAELDATDLDGDLRRDFDTLEYEPLPNELLFPRFLGQESGVYTSDLVLINLTGARTFDATAAIRLFNDNAEVFSVEYTFRCWERVPLGNVSMVFRNSFLANNTNQDPTEIVGLPSREAGWFKLQGAVAQSAQQTVEQPALLAALVGRDATGSSFAELPFEVGTRTNGAFFETSETLDPPGAGACFQTGCPCGNTTLFGETGCRNSSGYGARLDAAGTNLVASDDLVLVVSQAAASAPGLFLSGGSQTANPLGDGVLCAGNPTRRLQIAFTDLHGNAASSASLTGFVNPGDTVVYQYWFREPGLAGPCGTFSNLSNAYVVTWQ